MTQQRVVSVYVTKPLTLRFSPREDGGQRILCDELRGFILSNMDHGALFRDLPLVIRDLLEHGDYVAANPMTQQRAVVPRECWFNLQGDARLGRCTTEGCGGQPIYRLESGGLGSDYCSGCRAKLDQPAAAPSAPAASGDELTGTADDFLPGSADDWRAALAPTPSPVSADIEVIGSKMDDLAHWLDALADETCRETICGRQTAKDAALVRNGASHIAKLEEVHKAEIASLKEQLAEERAKGERMAWFLGRVKNVIHSLRHNICSREDALRDLQHALTTLESSR